MHASPSVSGGEKKKADVVQFYNQTRSQSTLLIKRLKCIQQGARQDVGLLACDVMFWTLQLKIVG